MSHTPHIMGILNLTPDSFSGDGRQAVDETIAFAHAMLEDGADIIDIGAESTRPGATPLSAEEEWQRLQPVLGHVIQLVHAEGKKVSIDTRHAATAEKALKLDADIINDVSGCTDPRMIDVLAASDCQIICMHSLTIPADKKVVLSADVDVIQEVSHFFDAAMERMAARGISRERVIFDPGIGFAKTAEQSIALLSRLNELIAAGYPLLVGHSRKSFLNKVTEAAFSDRDMLTIAVSQYLLKFPIDILRVHDVKSHAEMFHLMSELHAHAPENQ